MLKTETKTVINLLQEGKPSVRTVKRTIILLMRLDAQTDRLYKELNVTAKEQYINGRNDGIREFAEVVKMNQHKLFNAVYSELHFAEIIDNLVKEKTEVEK